MAEEMTNSTSVFLSYKRRADGFAARAIAQSLSVLGHDVFLDVESIDSGRFENIILNNIATRPHFIALISSAWVEATRSDNDWCRRECERALELKRNVVPIIIGDAPLSVPGHPLLDKLQALNALSLRPEYYDAAIEKLATRFLKQPTLQELEHMTAEEYCTAGERALREERFAEALEFFTKAIELNRSRADAFGNRAVAKYRLQDLQGALDDLDQAIFLDPGGEQLYQNKGMILQEMGRMQEAINTYHEMFTGKKGRIPGTIDLDDPDNAWMFY